MTCLPQQCKGNRDTEAFLRGRETLGRSRALEGKGETLGLRWVPLQPPPRTRENGARDDEQLGGMGKVVKPCKSGSLIRG